MIEKLLTGIRSGSSRPSTSTAGSSRIEPHLLRRLAQCGRLEIGVAGLDLAAGKRDLAAVHALVGRPLGEDHDGGAVRTRRHENEHRGGPIAGHSLETQLGPRPPVAEDGHQRDRARGQAPPDGFDRAAGRVARPPPRSASEPHQFGRFPPGVPLGVLGPSMSGTSKIAGAPRPFRPRPREPFDAFEPARASRCSAASTATASSPDVKRIAPVADVGVGDDPVARLEAALEERPRERVLDQALDRPLQRSRPEGRVVALAGDHGPGGRRQLEEQVLAGQPPGEIRQQQADDRLELGVGQRVEDDHLVDPVEELRAGTGGGAPRSGSTSSPRSWPRRGRRRPRSGRCRRCWS